MMIFYLIEIEAEHLQRWMLIISPWYPKSDTVMSNLIFSDSAMFYDSFHSRNNLFWVSNSFQIKGCFEGGDRQCRKKNLKTRETWRNLSKLWDYRWHWENWQVWHNSVILFSNVVTVHHSALSFVYGNRYKIHRKRL